MLHAPATKVTLSPGTTNPAKFLNKMKYSLPLSGLDVDCRKFPSLLDATERTFPVGSWIRVAREEGCKRAEALSGSRTLNRKSTNPPPADTCIRLILTPQVSSRVTGALLSGAVAQQASVAEKRRRLTRTPIREDLSSLSTTGNSLRDFSHTKEAGLFEAFLK
jgi:hypothetical protein